MSKKSSEDLGTIIEKLYAEGRRQMTRKSVAELCGLHSEYSYAESESNSEYEEEGEEEQEEEYYDEEDVAS